MLEELIQAYDRTMVVIEFVILLGQMCSPNARLYQLMGGSWYILRCPTRFVGESCSNIV